MLKFTISLIFGLIFFNLLPSVFSINTMDMSCPSNNINIISDDELPHYIINLDLPPEERWAHIVPIYNDTIMDVINTAYEELPWVFSRTIKYLAKKYFDEIPEDIGDYGKEMIGISNYSGIDLYEIVLYNIFYEVFSLCTSVVTENVYHDTIIHARNLDFGVLMEGIVPLLKKITISVSFTKNGKVIYRAHTFAGFVGIFTGMKPYKYSITINQRFAINGGFLGIMKWFRTKSPHWNSLIVRTLLEGDYDYNYVVDTLSTVELVAPVYYIVGGIKKDEGALITRDRYYNLMPIFLNSSKYVFQTNHDHWIEPFYFDDRTTSGKKYLDNYNHTIDNIEKLLISKPTLNRITIVGSIMIPKYDYMYGFIQNCIEPCHSINFF
jgi:acid ceramidase